MMRLSIGYPSLEDEMSIIYSDVSPSAQVENLSAVVSAGGVPASLAGGTRAAIMPDPNGIYLVLIQAPPPKTSSQ